MNGYLRYSQRTGHLFLCDEGDGRALLAVCYSGAGSYRNRAEFENLRAQGPIPRGLWKVGMALEHSTLGPQALPLYPAGHDAHGRTGFYIHGDNTKGDYSASRGCIIAPRRIRDAIVALDLKQLVVV